MVTTTTTPFGSVGAVESSFLQNARLVVRRFDKGARSSYYTHHHSVLSAIHAPSPRVVLARGLRREVYRPLLRHRRTSRLRSSAASDGGRPNGPSEIDDRGEKFSDERGEKLLDDLGVCPVPRAEK